MGDKLKEKSYYSLTLDLSSAHTDKEYDLPGTFSTMTALVLNGYATIKLNETSNDSIPLTQIRRSNLGPCRRIFLTNPAEYNSTVVLIFGNDQLSLVSDKVPFEGQGHLAATAAGYADVYNNQYANNLKNHIICINEVGGAESAYYSIDVANRGGYGWMNLITDVPIAASGQDFQLIAGPWHVIRVQAKDQSGHANIVVTDTAEPM